MAIININELDFRFAKFALWIEQWVSDSVNFLVLGGVVFVGLLIIGIVIMPFAFYGADQYLKAFSALHPGIETESLMIYWAFVFGIFIFKLLLILQSIYMSLVVLVYVLRDPDISRRNRLYAKMKRIKVPPEQTQSGASASIPPLTTFTKKNTPALKHVLVGSDIPSCPTCGKFTQVIKRGINGNRKRFYCKKCNKYFQKPIN